ncbi:MAG: hypothetical protein R2873_32165 [Caldilineaceae bacterium]
MSADQQRCQAKTQSGSQCKNKALDGSVYCRIHQGQPEPKPTPSKPTPSKPVAAAPAKTPDPVRPSVDDRSEIERFKAAILGR